MAPIKSLGVLAVLITMSGFVGSGAQDRAGFTDTASVIKFDLWFGYATSTACLRNGSFADIMSNQSILLDRMVWCVVGGCYCTFPYVWSIATCQRGNKRTF